MTPFFHRSLARHGRPPTLTDKQEARLHTCFRIGSGAARPTSYRAVVAYVFVICTAAVDEYIATTAIMHGSTKTNGTTDIGTCDV